MREVIIELYKRLNATDWDEIIVDREGTTEWGKPLWLEENFIHKVQDLIENPIFEESETIEEGMRKLREIYGEE